MEYGLIAFSSTYAAIYGEKCLKGVAVIQVMPVLREISAGCGIAIRFPLADLAAVRGALETSTLHGEEYQFFSVSGGGAPSVTPL